MSLSYGVLGLLNCFPMSGYDLKKIFNNSINFFWDAETSQIYRELKLLEKKGDISSKFQLSEKGPNKRIYEITKQGKMSLLKWLENPPDDIKEDQRDAFGIRILHSSLIGFNKLYPQFQKKLIAYQNELQQLDLVEQKLKEYVERSGTKEHLPYWKIVLSRGRYLTKANILWAQETLKYLEKHL
jgi:PadR family transcriptional regulator, regulatory protein AphA